MLYMDSNDFECSFRCIARLCSNTLTGWYQLVQILLGTSKIAIHGAIEFLRRVEESY